MSRPRPVSAWVPIVETRRVIDSDGRPCLEIREVEAHGRTATGPSIFLYPGDTDTLSADVLAEGDEVRLGWRALPPSRGGLS